MIRAAGLLTQREWVSHTQQLWDLWQGLFHPLPLTEPQVLASRIATAGLLRMGASTQAPQRGDRGRLRSQPQADPRSLGKFATAPLTADPAEASGTFNPLCKVLCILQSLYLCAIGPTLVFHLGMGYTCHFQTAVPSRSTRGYQQ